MQLKPAKLRASFHTLGCRLNQAETALLSNRFRLQGYEIVSGDEPCEVCVINSCTVTEHADRKCRQLVKQVLRRNPDTFVAVVGCYAQVAAEALQRIPGIDLIVGTQEKLNLADLIVDPVKRTTPQVVRPRPGRAPFTIAGTGLPAPTTRANLKIQDGCDFMCSFCIIPFARGRARSRAFDDLRREAVDLIAAGHKELVLTGVNLGTYSFAGKTFLDVVKMLLALPGLARLRISSIEPTTIPEELLELMAASKILCPHLHVPVQSGDDGVLAAMKRLYTRAEFEALLAGVQRRVPDAMISTDLMVGFPGESEAAFRASCDLLQNSPLAYAHVFTFSSRAGTAAARQPGQVPAAVKKERSQWLHEISEAKKMAFYRRFLGRELRVLLEEQSDSGGWVGFSDNYIKVQVNGAPLAENELVRVRLESVQGGRAQGTIVSQA
ncbi:MAG: tRNA (N(6)-L-threonylcarbamoyladenosine(37)-C(2))-methylthiotransferase MtaB [candidate division KSB1 bacterium]|nr:tRNA (N(6)-L-threonylcarbamoyladenosine(37)-C(2))-methylthiotransferase MtaB [candidate division KSB1 bacterium]MDZ7273385.1 tRNA (N(6)-L-threonylcarbamoyladenosine(37)-C(2))-methylthiotransferase MtaB [candidate division KSB1 bacterium]MDZ7288047.1 tRNA (N(6)-L-threonylcarbamoyladenosine(37)-C(2))-methylthiotransferase MtaB [candidate division KSB1 bacterium]MDZ7300101.1 tRNA (N(6)-L-threonylcarbamoyladenosine(37)-C(2))-methylthiotransferase MtaB [candidate division KSB1 bacterium]MDZ730722